MAGRRARAVAEVAAIWTVATAVVLLFAWKTRIGPAAGFGGDHGIHAGDLLALIVLWTVAALVSRRRLALSRPSPPSGAR